ncbi:uncharacterized protein [Danio rerio]|uniref:Uncharacterized protein n=1 Tax=Danio rerio TaxID=7955 RepID=A0AC58HT95_DANRE|nr:uncharacterized protein LOC103910757 [Danio rerio]|eukprot:XP_021326955.1 uncharacterized protein LOC103910757 [Danio rerio]
MDDTAEQMAAQASQRSVLDKELNSTTEMQQVRSRSSSRKRNPTEKGLEMQKQETKKHEKAFNKAYTSWKQTAKEIRCKLKALCTCEELEQILKDIQTSQDVVTQHYAPLLRNQTATPEIVRRVDVCSILSTEICDLVSKRIETVDVIQKREVVKERVRQILNKEEYESIFGCTNTETIISVSSQTVESLSAVSETSSEASSKRADAEAELAAKVEQKRAIQEISNQQARLVKLENDWKLEEARMLADIKQKEIEIRSKLEEEKAKLQLLQAEEDVNIAAARVKAYNNAESCLEESSLEDDETGNVIYPERRKASNKPQRNPVINPLLSQTFQEERKTKETENLAQALVNSLSISRLPVPEPTTFNGDPLKFIEWKMSFTALIDCKSIPASEKMFYLKTYLAGEARKAVEGFFYKNSDDTYQGAWRVLEERYGNPFIIQRAFRERLMRWPKVGVNDPFSLREFSDFLQGCVEAIPQVKGLSILNDCEENYKLLKKLPEWIVCKWNRIVVEELDMTGDYPSFKQFAEFLKESKIACNPFTSPLLVSSKVPDDKYLKRAKAFNIKAQVKDSRPEFKVTSPCSVCKSEMHSIVKCPIFAEKPMDDKRSFIRENHMCFGCLRRGHIFRDCRRRHICGTCGLRHPTCLHEDKRKHSEVSQADITSEAYTSQEGQRAMSYAVTQHVSATSSIVPVFISTVEEPQNEILTYALLDTQSDTSFILKDFIDELQVSSQAVKLKLSTMTTTDTITSSNKVSGLRIRGLQGGKCIQIPQVYTCDFIPVDKAHIPTKKTALCWSHLKHIANEMPPLQSCDIGLLIGYDCPSALAPLEVIIGKENEPFAQKTALGWSIIGLCNPHLDRQGSQSFVHRVSVKEMRVPTANDVLKVLECDFNEKSYEDKYVSQEDVRFIRYLSDNIKHKEDGHFQLPLPFKSSNPPSLPNNKRLALLRLQHLGKKLRSNQQYHENYKIFMEEMLNKGDAEIAPVIPDKETAWYIPHHGVYHPHKPDKLRVVFDCSSKFCGISLNDTLLTGPDLINSLVGVLCRFRKEAVAVTCDIEKMFHQFHVPPEERDYLRFLWWKNGDLKEEPIEYRMTVHLFGAASSPGCANFGLKYLAEKYKSEYSEASSFVNNNFYVDDGLISVPSIQEAKDLIAEAKTLCKLGGLRLHKFNSSEKEILRCVDSSEWAVSSKPLNLTPESSGHVLGIQWSTKDDTFSFNTQLKDQPATRRGILSIVSSLYDPIGFVAPFLLKGKCILQELCQRNMEWDDSLPDDLIPRWEEWKNTLQDLKDFTVPRCYYPSSFSKIVLTELHHFSDASNLGYGACSYLRVKSDKNEVHCCLVMAKARVAPIKIKSIPRLELAAAVVSARLSVLLKAELQMMIDQEFFWSDSQVVLAYLNNEARRFHVFVANRVQLIKEITNTSQWYHVNTSQNPADHASRGLLISELRSTNWMTGPTFLWDQEVCPAPNTSTKLLVGDPEVKLVQVRLTKSSDTANFLDRFGHFSSLRTLINVVARIKRLALRKKCLKDIVTVEERKCALQAVIKLIQERAFSQEIQTIQGGKTLQKSSSLFHLDPILKNGLRVGGRLKGSSLSEEVKHPLILPKESHITNLILKHYHSKICHQGRSQTLMELRTHGFWIIGGSKSVAKLIYNCVQCRKLRRPVEEQQMAELPKERTEASSPFCYTGMDCFGPFIIKKGRKEYKRYGLLFTCLSSRAVHIEMLEDLSTDMFINALRCFISLRGAVRQLYCDCGTNFVGARNEFKQALKECDVKTLERYLAENQCEFIFNAASASHSGGVWERQIRTVRNVLNSTLSLCPGRLDDSSLRTLFYEAMAIVNSRPLTVDGINDPKSLEPLTPNHLVLMKSETALPPPGKFLKEDVYATKRWRRVQYLIEQFWSRWKREYLLNISTRQKWHVPRRNLKVNDIVIIKDDMLPRNKWQLGRVVEVFPGNDGLVRRVKVQPGEQKQKMGLGHHSSHSVIERPIQKLVVIVESD